MDKFLKFFSQLAPVISFYPRWVQVVFAVTFGMCLLSVFLFAIYYSAAAVRQADSLKEQRQQEAHRKITFDLSVMTDGSAAGPKSLLTKRNPLELQYTITRTDRLIQIEPEMEYLSEFRRGGPVQGLSYWWSPFEWQFPRLDIKIANNTNETLLFTEAVFRVASSRTDPSPFLHIHKNPYNVMHFLIVNEGWGPATRCELAYNLVSVGLEPNFESDFPYKQVLPDITEDLNVDIKESLRQAGVDLQALDMSHKKYGLHGFLVSEDEFAKIRAGMGPFPEGAVLVVGVLQFYGGILGGKERKYSLRFATEVSLVKPAPGAPRPPTYQYDAKLETDRDNYEVRVPISQEVRPGDTDRFNIRLGALKSSFHDLVVELIYNQRQILKSNPVEIEILVPRSGAAKTRLKNADYSEATHFSLGQNIPMGDGGLQVTYVDMTAQFGSGGSDNVLAVFLDSKDFYSLLQKQDYSAKDLRTGLALLSLVVLDRQGKKYGPATPMRERDYLMVKAVAPGDVETGWSAMMGQLGDENVVALFSVPENSQGFTLYLTNPWPKEGQARLAAVDLGR